MLGIVYYQNKQTPHTRIHLEKLTSHSSSQKAFHLSQKWKGHYYFQKREPVEYRGPDQSNPHPISLISSLSKMYLIKYTYFSSCHADRLQLGSSDFIEI